MVTLLKDCNRLSAAVFARSNRYSILSTCRASVKMLNLMLTLSAGSKENELQEVKNFNSNKNNKSKTKENKVVVHNRLAFCFPVNREKRIGMFEISDKSRANVQKMNFGMDLCHHDSKKRIPEPR